jgi:hypothetical protein
MIIPILLSPHNKLYDLLVMEIREIKLGREGKFKKKERKRCTHEPYMHERVSDHRTKILLGSVILTCRTLGVPLSVHLSTSLRRYRFFGI